MTNDRSEYENGESMQLELEIPMALAQHFYQEPLFMEAIEQLKLEPAAFRPILPGERIDLGEIELEVYGVPGHTPGGICLLDRRDRISLLMR